MFAYLALQYYTWDGQCLSCLVKSKRCASLASPAPAGDARTPCVLTCGLACAAVCRNGTPQEMAAAFIGGASAVSPFSRQLQRRQQQQQAHPQFNMPQLHLQATLSQKQTHARS